MKDIKIIKRVKNSLIIAVFLFGLLSGQAQNSTDCSILNPNYSIKSRWNIKASYAMYNTENTWIKEFLYRTNTRLELNYGFSPYLEAGVYGGGQFHDKFWIDRTCFAPAFGTQVNFHLLPLFVQNPNSRWELYLTAKYGGMVFTRHEKTYINSTDGKPFTIPRHSEYEHEYSVGFGGGVYFWKVFGLYAEVCLGRFYSPPHYEPYLTNINGVEEWKYDVYREDKIPCKIRGGFTFKF